MMKISRSVCAVFMGAAFFTVGCVSAPPRLSYIAAERSDMVIREDVKDVDMTFSKSGFFATNVNFRPAPDINDYIQKGQAAANSKVLRNADIEMNVPLAFAFFFCGYQVGWDKLKAGNK